MAIASSAVSQDSAPPRRFQAASKGLADSTMVSPLIRARAEGHMAVMANDPTKIATGLRACPDERTRLAYLDAVLSGGARSFDEAEAESKAIQWLLATTPEDRAPQIALEIQRLETEADSVTPTWGTITADDLTWRPFVWSLDTPADRLARLSPSMRKALLEIAGSESRPAIIAAVLAAVPEDAREERRAIIAGLDLDSAILGPAVISELVRRRATNALIDLVRDEPAVIALSGVRVAAAASIARDQPESAIELLRGEENISRLPGAGQSVLRRGLAEGRRSDPDPELWRLEIAQIGQADEKLAALLALETMYPDDANPEEVDPERTFEETKSMRTLKSGMVVSDIDQGYTTRDHAIQALANLFRTARYDLAFTFLIPNTTEPTRAADQWLPVRIGLLGEALAEADAAPDGWIPLIDSIQRLDRLDGQIAALRVLQESYERAHGDQDLPEDLRLSLNNALLEIAID